VLICKEAISDDLLLKFKFMNKKLKILGIGVLLIGLAVAGWFLYTVSQSQNGAELTQNNTENQKQEQRQVEESDAEEGGEQIERVKTEDIDISNWKESCNQEYSFCVKYPEGWEIKKRNYEQATKTIHIEFGDKNKNYYYEGTPLATVMRFHISTDSQQKIYFNNRIKSNLKKYTNCKSKKIFVDHIVTMWYQCFFGNEFVFDKNDQFWHIDDNGGMISLYPELTDTFYNVINSLKFTK
jgi:hypothetical protein